MPPRIPPHRLPQPKSYQCFRTRPHATPESTAPPSHVCQFHATPSNGRRKTRLRRNMFEWLKGPGKVFREPLPGSTNYLSAYDRQGNLIRASANNRSNRPNDNYDDSELKEDEGEIQRRELEEGISEEEVGRRAEQRIKRRGEKAELEARGGVPKEQPRDLRPYPLNQQFRSQPVLSEELREKIYELIVLDRIDLKSVSATFGVDIRRVAAVVRLKSLEKQWVAEGKQLAKPYNDAVLAMLPQTPYKPDQRNPPTHEPINDLPVHPWTRQQIFLPAGESRAFTREDAAKTFHPTLLPADKRIAHPELVQITEWEMEGHDRETRQRMMREKDAEAAAAREEKERRLREHEARTQVVVKGRRWDFKFEDVSVSAEKVGKDGRGRHAVGLRYGMPLQDRKRGQVKIPTSVE